MATLARTPKRKPSTLSTRWARCATARLWFSTSKLRPPTPRSTRHRTSHRGAKTLSTQFALSPMSPPAASLFTPAPGSGISRVWPLGRPAPSLTSRCCRNPQTGGSGVCSDHPLWVSGYTSSPPMPGGWTDWTFWQYTDKASIPGISGGVDCSYFHGSTTQFAAWAKRSGGAPA